ncbi:MAG: GAF domain-containing protein [bacterium]
MVEPDSRPFSPLLREIFDRMPAGVAVFDRDLHVVEWNASFYRFLADNRPDLAAALTPGANLEEVSPWPLELIGHLFDQALNGQSVTRDAAPYTGPAGTTYWDIVLSPLFENGQIVGVLDTTTEATRRVLAARDAEEREELFRLVFDTTSDAVILNDFATGFVADANPAAARMHGYTREEFIGIDPAKFIHPDSLPLLGQYQELVRSGKDFRSRARDVRKDGTIFDVDVMGTSFEFRGKKYLAAVVRDISDQVAAEHEKAMAAAALRQAQAMLEQRVEERTRELSSILDVSKAVLSTLDLDLIFERVLDEVAKVIPYSGCSVSILDGEAVEIVASRNVISPEFGALNVGRRYNVTDVEVIWNRMLTGTPFFLDDIFDNSPDATAFRNLVTGDIEIEFPDIRSWLSVPMINQGEVLGVLTVSRSEVNGFDSRIAQLASAFGGQVAVAVANARLYQQAQRRAREMEGLASIAAALTFEMPSEEALTVLAGRVVAASSAVAASITLYDDTGRYRSCGAAGLPRGYVEAMVEAIDGGAPSVTAETFHLGTRRVLSDTRRRTLADPRFAPAHPYLEEANWDNAVITPISSRGRNLGTLDTYFTASNSPDAEELRLLAAISDQVAIGIENTELVEQLRRRVFEMDALYRAYDGFHQSLELHQVLDALALSAVEAIGADRSAALIYQESPPFELTLGAAAGVTAAERMALIESLKGVDTSSFRGLREPRFTSDTTTEPREVQGIVRAAGIVSVIDVPITIAGRSFGLFGVGWTRQHSITQGEVRLATALAQQAAVAIENARLYERAQFAASLEERQRLARELHDSVSQALYGISLGTRTARALVEKDPARAIEPLEYVSSLAEAGLAELRALIFELRPESLSTEGLVAALEKQFAALQARHGIEVDAELCLEPDLRLDLKEVLYRVGQEALHNTVKHARATHVTVSLAPDAGQVVLQITDNGIGFDTSGEFPGHLGLRSMAERTARVGGQLQITSAPGDGTAIRLAVPHIPGHLPGDS